jgi:hypothetical protein
MNIYSHTDLLEKTEAVRRLPRLWERFFLGSAPESQDGINGQKKSLAAVGAPKTAEPDDSTEVLTVSGLAADFQQDSVSVGEIIDSGLSAVFDGAWWS